MTGAPSTGQVVLRAGEAKTVYATAQFSDRFSRNPSDAFAGGEVKATYTAGREAKSVASKYQAFVYERGAIDWNAGVARVASFVNPADPELRALASDFISTSGETIDENSAAASLQLASAVLNGLRSLGVKYLADPNNPYAEVRSQSDLVDNIQLPADLINSRRGDCDDLTAAYCTLLESIGIETYVLDVPGHLFMMFDTGLPAAYRMALKLPDNMYVIRDGHVLIPVEITALQSGFVEAWTEGVSEYYRWLALDELEAVDLRSAWSSYPPALASTDAISPVVDPPAYLALVRQDREAMDQIQTQYLASSYYRTIDDLGSDPEILRAAAVRQVFEGNLDRALALFEKASTFAPQDVTIKINLANVYSLMGRHDEARLVYSEVSVGSAPEGYCQNLLASRCLATPAGDAEAIGSLVAVVDSLSQVCADWYETTISVTDMQRCASAFENRVDFALCVQQYLEGVGLEDDARGTERGQTAPEPIRPEVRIFRWYE
jgi:tetratricopeptide (TPR) repeat protein